MMTAVYLVFGTVLLATLAAFVAVNVVSTDTCSNPYPDEHLGI